MSMSSTLRSILSKHKVGGTTTLRYKGTNGGTLKGRLEGGIPEEMSVSVIREHIRINGWIPVMSEGVEGSEDDEGNPTMGSKSGPDEVLTGDCGVEVFDFITGMIPPTK